MMRGTSSALPGPAGKTGQKPAARTLFKALRKSPAGRETNSSAAFISLCHPTSATGQELRPSERTKLIQIIRPRDPVHHKAVSS